MNARSGRAALAVLLLVLTAHALASDNATVLITGANRGLGFAFAEKYSARGWHVIATARRPEQARELAALAERTGRVRIEQLDITDPESIDALADRLDGIPIDVLLNNAGMLGEEPEQKLGTLDPERFDAYMRVNAMGALLVSESLLSNVRASRQKKILAMSAVAASFAAYPEMHRGLYYYKASKVALNMIMRNIALDTEQYGVIVAVLSPGVVNTYGTEMPPTMPGLVDIDTSVDGMMKVIDELTIDGTGKWYRYTGKIIDW